MNTGHTFHSLVTTSTALFRAHFKIINGVKFCSDVEISVCSYTQ